MLIALIEGLIRHSSQRYNWGSFGVSLFDLAARVTITRVLPISIVTPLAAFVISNRLTTIPVDTPLNIFLLFIGTEFSYYWAHRLSHKIRWFWVSHVVHHSPNELNFSVAFRIGALTEITGSSVFYLGLFWIGFPAWAVTAAILLNFLYQFWIHSDWIPRLGWFEYLFNTPSAHRVHHASNPEYINSNFGGVLIVFDRLFGTYVAERSDVPCRYGLTTPQLSLNPLRVELEPWAQLGKDLMKSRSISEFFNFILRPPGWIPMSLFFVFTTSCASAPKSTSLTSIDWIYSDLETRPYQPVRGLSFLRQYDEKLNTFGVRTSEVVPLFEAQSENSDADYIQARDALLGILYRLRDTKPTIWNGDGFDFIRVERQSQQTIVTVLMPHVSPIYSSELILTTISRLPNYNHVIVDGFKLFSNSRAYSAKEVQSLFTRDMVAYQKRHGGQYVLHVICFATLAVADYLNSHHSLYERVTFYAPMVAENVRGHQISPSNIYGPLETWMPFNDLLTLVYAIESQPRQLPIFEKYDRFNQLTFSNLYKLYEDRSLSLSAKRPTVVLAANDLVVPKENSQGISGASYHILENASHLSIFYNWRLVRSFLRYSLRPEAEETQTK